MGDCLEIREANPKLEEIPFNSRLKYQVSVHELGGSGSYLVVMKGAPEIVFKRCSHVLVDGQTLQIDEEIVQQFEEANRKLPYSGTHSLDTSLEGR